MSDHPMIYKAIAACMKEIGPIVKDRPGGNYKFRGIDDVYNRVSQVLADNGVVVTPSYQVLSYQEYDKGKMAWASISLLGTFVASAEDGSSVTGTATGGAAEALAVVHKIAASNVHKTWLTQWLIIPTKEMAKLEARDPHKDSPTVNAAKAAKVELWAVAKECYSATSDDDMKAWVTDKAKEHLNKPLHLCGAADYTALAKALEEERNV